MPDLPESRDPPEPGDGGHAPLGMARTPVYAAEEVKPPVPEANSFGGGIDAVDLPPTSADDAAGPGSAHDDDGWRAIETKP